MHDAIDCARPQVSVNRYVCIPTCHLQSHSWNDCLASWAIHSQPVRAKPNLLERNRLRLLTILCLFRQRGQGWKKWRIMDRTLALNTPPWYNSYRRSTIDCAVFSLSRAMVVSVKCVCARPCSFGVFVFFGTSDSSISQAAVVKPFPCLFMRQFAATKVLVGSFVREVVRRVHPKLLFLD